MVKGELVHLKDEKIFPIEECGTVFCVGFKTADRTDKRVSSIAQAILISDDLTYEEFSVGLGAVIVKELLKTAKGNHGLELDMADKFISSFVGVLEKRVKEYEENKKE